MNKNIRGEIAMGTLLLVGLLTVLGVIGGPKVVKAFRNENQKVEQAQAKKVEAKDNVTAAEKDVVKDAQLDVKATGIALESDNVPLAKRFNEKADTKLTLVTGGVSTEELRTLRSLVERLQSENESIRTKAEKDLAKRDAKSDDLQKELVDAKVLLAKRDAELTIKTDKLQQAYTREEELADKYRTIRNVAIGSVIVAILGVVGWFYVRLSLGGALGSVKAAYDELQTSVAHTVNDLRKSHPATAEAILNPLDVNLSPKEQELVRVLAAKLK